MKNRELKRIKSRVVVAFREAIKVCDRNPLQFSIEYVEENWGELEPFAKQLIAQELGNSCEAAMRVRLNDQLSEQMELDLGLFHDLPVGIPTGRGSYKSIGLGTEEDIEFIKADHRTQIDGHERMIERWDELVRDRRSLGIARDQNYYEWRRKI